MKKIKLTQGKFAIVDISEYDKVIKLKWHFDGNYAANKTKKKVYMHRFILNATSPQVDHINGNKLDNRKENLRECTAIQNGANRTTFKPKNKFRGIYFHKINKKWIAGIRKDGKNLYLGSYSTQAEAGVAYIRAASEIYGKFINI